MTSLALVALILLQCHQGSLECQASPGTFPPLGPGCGECRGEQWGWWSCTDKIENLYARDGVCVRDACVLLEATHTQHLNTVKDEAEQEAALATQHLNTVKDETEQEATLATQHLNTVKNEAEQEAALATQHLNTVKDEAEQEAALATHTQHLNTVKDEAEQEATHTQHLNTVKDEAEQEATLATHTQHLNTAEDNTQGHRTLEANTQHPKTATDTTKHHKTTQDTHTHHKTHTHHRTPQTTQETHTHHHRTPQTTQETHTHHHRTPQTTQETHTHHHRTPQTHTNHPTPPPPPPDTHQTHTLKENHPNKQSPTDILHPLHPPTSLAPTSTWCHTMPHSTLQCHFENLYYSPVYQEFAFVLGKDSALEGVDSVEALQNHLHLSTALGHNGFLFHVTAVPHDAVQGEVWSLDHHTLVMARFKPDNLFHVLHDDVMPVYFTVLRLCAVLGSPCPPITLLAVDEHTESPYSALYSALGHQLLLARDLQNIVWLRLSQATVGLSHHSVWYQYGFRRPQGPVETRLGGAELKEFAVFVISRLGVGINSTTDAVKGVGVAAENLWGVGVDTIKDIPKNSLETRENDIENLENYLVSQGNTLENVGNSLDICGNALQSTKNTPGSANKPKNTLENIIEPAENTLENTLGLSNAPEHTPGLANLPEHTPTNTPASQPSPSTRQSPPLAVLLTRRTTRKILNEKQLAETIQRELNKTYGEGVVRIMSLEEDGLDEAIRAVSQARVLVGMHGAGLGLGMFMSSGTLLIEMWPFGVDPASARVYRAMCGLRGFGVTYRAWVNEDVGNTRTHPHYPPHFGGVRHLPQEERKRVVSSLRGDKLVNVTCCMDVDWLYRIYQDTVVRLHAHGDAHGRAHEAHTRTNTHRRTRTNTLEVNAHRDIHGDAHEADTHTDAHRDPDAHTDAHEVVLKSVPFSVVLREGLSSLHSSPQSPPLQSSPQPLLQSSLGSSHTLKSMNSSPQSSPGPSQSSPPPPESSQTPTSPLASPPQTFHSSEAPSSSSSQSSPPPPSPPQLPRTPPPGRVHKLTCSLQTHNKGTKLELSWQAPWIVRSLGCGDLVYEVVMAEHSEARASTVFVRRERMVLVFNKRLAFVDVWVTSFCDGVEGLAVFVRCVLG